MRPYSTSSVLDELMPVSVKKVTPCMAAFDLQSCGRNCSPGPDLVSFKLVFPRIFFSGGVFFLETLVSQEPMEVLQTDAGESVSETK